MLSVAAGLVQARSRWPRWLAWLSTGAALGSVILLSRAEGDEAGLWQRLWLADNLAWLVVLAAASAVPAAAEPGDPRQRSGDRAAA
jgi:hypothetical protein